jgi:hypothetical protein
MSNRKNYNSIVFLTTLSVYLGLVLVGGVAPSVLAQAATTRNFDIKNEIVVEDDLDKKPDDSVSESFEQFQDALDSDFITGSILALLDDLKKLKQIEKYDGEQRFEIEYLFRHYEGLNKYKVDKIEGGGNNWLFTACEEPAYLLDFKLDGVNPFKFYSYDKPLKAKVTNTNVKFLSENGELSLQITSKQKSDEDAKKLAGFFKQVFDYRSSSQDLNNYERLIYLNTKATAENNQVFIVTRLPRASIDDLLAEK